MILILYYKVCTYLRCWIQTLDNRSVNRFLNNNLNIKCVNETECDDSTRNSKATLY